MKELKIRRIKESTYAGIKEEAERKNVGRETLARNILENHVLSAEITKTELTYKAFTEKVLLLYQQKIEELEQVIQENNQLMEAILEKLEKER